MSAECSPGNIPPGYKQTEVGVIPQDWDIEPLRCDVTLLSGQHVLAQHCNTSGDGVPYLTGPADFPSGKIQLTKFTNRPTTLCKAGDILVTVKGSGSGTLVEADDSYCISRQLMAIRVKEWNAKFLFYSLLYNASKIKTSSTGLIPGLSRFDILDQEIPLPPTLAEQEAIAEALGDADAFIESLEQLISKKRQIKQGAMQELLTGKRRLPGFSGEWETKRLGDIAEIRDGTHQTPKYVENGIPFYSVENVTNDDFTNTKFISEAEHRFLTRFFKIEKGDILMTRIGSIGDCKFIDWDVDASFYVSLALLKIRKGYSAEFICHYSKTEAFKKDIELHSLQSAIPKKINLGPISDVKIKIPDNSDEQEAIAAILSDMDSEITALEEKLAKARQLKQGMMQELLTGRIRLL
jgi:type I restriction enzyme S subunit